MSVYEGHRINDDVIMRMGFVQMCPNNDLKVLAEQPPCKLTSDLMCLLRRDLSGGKGLNKVIAEDAACLAKLLLGPAHGGKCGFRRFAIQSAYKSDGIHFL